MKNRKKPAHLPNISRDNQSVILFVTVCASRRNVNSFATAEMHEIVVRAWNNTRSYRVGGYVIMPDHIHLFCAPTLIEVENAAMWVKYWKSLVSREIVMKRSDLSGGTSVTSSFSTSHKEAVEVELLDRESIFQRDCWDTQLRRGESYHEKWLYVRNNPVRAGLAQNAEEWPYSGVIHDLRW